MVRCGRCNLLLRAGAAELCWYCFQYLCRKCWEEYGHCGHVEADRVNAAGRLLHEMSIQ